MKKTLVAVFAALCHCVTAQVFPVQVTTQLIPPYSPYLADYTAPGAQNFTVQIRTNDVTLVNYPCRLRLSIEGVGITIRTRSDFAFAPLTLAGGGTPEVFHGDELAKYFHPEALEFSGYSRTEFEKTGRLPEGVYRFSIEVLDYYRGTVVSNKGTSIAWIVLNDPPLLNTPADRTTIEILDPPNILFSWTPRHTGSPNAAFETEYTFRLVELWPGLEDPEHAFLSQPALYEATTTETRLVYGLSEPTLIPGRTYAWRITARDTGGKDLFKNNGNSEVFSFRYGEELAPPENLLLRWAKPTTLAIRWDPVKVPGEQVKYRLAYRPRRRNTNERREWYETRTKFTDKTLYDLQPDTEYEVKVRTELPTRESKYTDTQIFKTLKTQPSAFVCKDNVDPPPVPRDTRPTFSLSVNDTLHVGGYDVLVRDVMRVDGKYFGSGLAIIPWFNDAKIRVTFENISVNDKFWLTKGIVKSVWSGESRFLLNTEKPITPGQAPKAGQFDVTVVATDTLITVHGSAIASVTKDEDHNIVITTTDGDTEVLRKGEIYAVADDVGNGYVIDKEGNIAKTTAHTASAAAARGHRDYDLRFAFSKGDSRFGFDEKTLDVLASQYQRLEDGSYAPWKALATSHVDGIQGRILSGDADDRKITFRVGTAQVVPFTKEGAEYKLRLAGKAAGMEEELLAMYTPGDSLPAKVLGKVNLATYNLMRYTVVVVPVNDATVPGGLDASAIAEGLNAVYNQAVVEWNVSIDKPLTVALPEVFDDGQRGFLANYTADMRKVLKAYGHFAKNTFYLFLIRHPRDQSALGYMPRSRQAGFIFTEPHHDVASEFIKTIAHELGHSAFNLQHIFSEQGIPVGTTDNLMDYAEGTRLFKYQWDAIHDTHTILGLFDEVGENALEQVSAEQLWWWWQKLPPYKKAAVILKEHFEDLEIFKSVASTCDDTKCVITAELSVNDDLSYTTETTFLSTQSADELLSTLISDYRVDLWLAMNVKAEDSWDELYNWWRKQNDDLAQHKGFQITAINFLADVITGATMVPAVEGWITGKHWRDGHELRGWEQALAGLDLLTVDQIAKGTLTNLIVRVGSKSLRLFSIPKVTRRLIANAIANGAKVTVVSESQFFLRDAGGSVIAHIVDDAFYLVVDGREIAINLSKRTTLLGRYFEGTKPFLMARFHDSKLFNMLDVEWAKPTAPSEQMLVSTAAKNSDEFWTTYNRKFIDEAISNGDDFVLLTKPTDLRNLFYQDLRLPKYIDIDGNILDIQLTGILEDDIRRLLSMKAFPTMYGREVIYLCKKLGLTIEELTRKFYK